MDRGAWQATVHGAARVRHDLAAKQQQLSYLVLQLWPSQKHLVVAAGSKPFGWVVSSGFL